jgi:hypothetical protein
MTGRAWVLTGAALLAGCLDWDPVDDAVTGGEPGPPALRNVTPAGMPPVHLPAVLEDRCRIVCRIYEDCFGPAVDTDSCLHFCTTEVWVESAGDLECYLSRGCTELWMCHDS